MTITPNDLAAQARETADQIDGVDNTPWSHSDLSALLRQCADALERRAVPSGTKVADIGFRWDGERQQHIPQLIVEFDPVPANSGSGAKGWRDRDSVAAMLAATPPAQVEPTVRSEVAELRRLSAVNVELLGALKLIASAEKTALDLAYCKGIARAAIQKAEAP